MRPLRILHIGNRDEKFPGMRDYATAIKINNGLVREGRLVRFFDDREAARALAPFRNRKLGTGPANRLLLTLCRNFEPEVIAFCTADVVRPETLAEARSLLPGVAVLHYTLDPLCLPHNRDRVLRYGDVVDHSFATTAGQYLRQVASARAPVGFIPNPVDPSVEVHRCHERADLPTDVFFAGNVTPWTDPDSLRRQAPDLLAERLTDVKSEVFGSRGRPRIWGAEFTRALGRAKIGLNLSNHTAGLAPGDGGPLYLYSSDRLGLLLGNGLMVISEAVAQLAEIYGKDAIVEAADADELVDRIRHYARHDAERRTIAARGHAVAHAEFNERLVARYMLEKTLGLPHSHPYAWPTGSHGPPAAEPGPRGA
jgi:Glycosyl transferases group 1